MKTKGTFSIFTSRFSLLYKVIAYLLLITIIFSVLGVAAFVPTLKGVISELKNIGIKESLINYVNALLKGDASGSNITINEAYNNLVISIDKVFHVLDNHDTAVIVASVFLFAFIILFMYAYHLVYYTTSGVIHAFMSSNSRYGFASNFVANLKKSSLFSVLYTPLVVIYYLLSIMLIVVLTLVASKINGYFGIWFGYLLSVALLALRRTLFAAWIPAMVVDGKNPIEALKINEKFIQKRFLKLFSYYFTAYMTSIVALAIFTILTAAVATIFMFAAILVIFQVIDMVEYYTYFGYKYYIDDQTVVDPKRKYRDAVLENPNNLDQK